MALGYVKKNIFKYLNNHNNNNLVLTFKRTTVFLIINKTYKNFTHFSQ